MVDISHCLWFDKEAEDAAKFYTSIFKDGKILNVTRYGKAGHEIHGQPEGQVMTVVFEILGQKYLAINGGPIFKHSEAFSIVVSCDTQEEIDYYWEKLKVDGGSKVECGWLKDKFGLSWQVSPRALGEMLSGPREKAERVTAAFMKMKKFDIAELKRAYEGK